MTRVSFERSKTGEIIAFTAEGHTNYGIEGEDIVCAAASSVIQTAALGIYMVANVQAATKKDEKRALFTLKLPDKMTPGERHDCAVILNTMAAGLNDLQEQYSDFIELNGLK